MKRDLTFWGWLIGIVATFATFFMDLCFVVALGIVTDKLGGKLPSGIAALFYIVVIFLAVLLCLFAFNITSFGAAKKGSDEFRNRLSMFIVSIIFNVLGAVFCIVVEILTKLYLAGSFIESTLWLNFGSFTFIVPFIAFILSIIFVIYDLTQERERVEEYEDSNQKTDEGIAIEKESNKQESVQGQERNSDRRFKLNEMEEAIEKLNEMKEKELLSIENYEKIKTDIIKEYSD